MKGFGTRVAPTTLRLQRLTIKSHARQRQALTVAGNAFQRSDERRTEKASVTDSRPGSPMSPPHPPGTQDTQQKVPGQDGRESADVPHPVMLLLDWRKQCAAMATTALNALGLNYDSCFEM